MSQVSFPPLIYPDYTCILWFVNDPIVILDINASVGCDNAPSLIFIVPQKLFLGDWLGGDFVHYSVGFECIDPDLLFHPQCCLGCHYLGSNQ